MGKSKKKKKSKKTPSTAKHLNPFYIEEPSYQSWEGDWRNDTELEEEAAFLNDGDTGWRRDLPQRRTHHPRRPPLLNLRIGGSLACLTFVFWIILATSNSHTDESKTRREPAAPNTTTATPTAAPFESETAAPVAVVTEAPVASAPDVSPSPLAVSIIVLGERYSGAEFLTSALKTCYPDANVQFGFSRSGYFFQELTPGPATATRLYYAVRNPYDWFLNMQTHPKFAPDHQGLTLQEFCHASWKGNYSAPTHEQCQEQFRSNQVMPCNDADTILEDDTPVYELDANGKVYDSLLKLRRDKILQVFSLREHWNISEFVVVPIEEWWSPSPPPALQNCTTDTRVPNLEPLPNVTDARYLKWMHETIDWGTEKLLGYTSRSEDDPW